MKFFGKTIILTIFFILGSITAFAADSNAFLSIDGENLPVYTLQKAGNDNENFVILLLGDGYTENEQKQFFEDISQKIDALLATEPFRSYSDKINIYAVGAVSEESGVSTTVDSKNTYFKVAHFGNIASFVKDGESKARTVKDTIEKKFLDNGATVGTIHVLSNTTERFGTSLTPLFSFSSMDSSGEETLIHEIAHSIGRLKDEYGALKSGVNASASEIPEELPWIKMFGFRGIGYTHNDNNSPGYIPSVSCIMKDEYAGSFCEVCKLELAKRLNSYMYMQSPEKYYVANPDITLEHSPNTLGSEYEKCRIINGNLLKAQNKSLELRTIVQNLTDMEQHLKLLLQIIDEYGNVKLSNEAVFTVSPLPANAMYEYEYEPAKESISVTIEKVSGLTFRDKVLGQVIDCDTNSVIVTDKTEKLPRRRINIHHKLKAADGTVTEMQNTSISTVYAAEGEKYSPKPLKQLNGYAYIGNSLESDNITVTDKDIEIDFYYENAKISSDISNDGKTVTVKPHNIAPGNKIVLAMYSGDIINEIKYFDYTGEDIVYTPAKFSDIKLMAWNTLMLPLCKPTYLRK